MTFIGMLKNLFTNSSSGDKVDILVRKIPDTFQTTRDMIEFIVANRDMFDTPADVERWWSTNNDKVLVKDYQIKYKLVPNVSGATSTYSETIRRRGYECLGDVPNDIFFNVVKDYLATSCVVWSHHLDNAESRVGNKPSLNEPSPDETDYGSILTINGKILAMIFESVIEVEKYINDNSLDRKAIKIFSS